MTEATRLPSYLHRPSGQQVITAFLADLHQNNATTLTLTQAEACLRRAIRQAYYAADAENAETEAYVSERMADYKVQWDRILGVPA